MTRLRLWLLALLLIVLFSIGPKEAAGMGLVVVPVGCEVRR